jgi:hypothetical protein
MKKVQKNVSSVSTGGKALKMGNETLLNNTNEDQHSHAASGKSGGGETIDVKVEASKNFGNVDTSVEKS